MNGPLRVLLVGANGRMGQAVAAAIGQDSGLTIAGGIHRDDAIAAVIDQCDVVIDFSVADASTEIAQACAEYRKPLVIGTTGQSVSASPMVSPRGDPDATPSACRIVERCE